jgi:hypothetical protein
MPAFFFSILAVVAKLYAFPLGCTLPQQIFEVYGLYIKL